MNTAEFAQKVDWEGGALEAIFGYGLSLKDVDPSETELRAIMAQIDEEARPVVNDLFNQLDDLLAPYWE